MLLTQLQARQTAANAVASLYAAWNRAWRARSARMSRGAWSGMGGCDA